MLTLNHVGTGETLRSTVEIDDYVPLTVEMAHGETAPTIYWRAKPDVRTLVEVGLSSMTGGFRSLTVTSIPSTSVLEAKAGSRRIECEIEGVPCFDTRPWMSIDEYGGRFRDEKVSVRLIVGLNDCSLEIGEPAAPIMSVKAGDLRYLFDDRQTLVRVDVLGLESASAVRLRGFSSEK